MVNNKVIRENEFMQKEKLQLLHTGRNTETAWRSRRSDR